MNVRIALLALAIASVGRPAQAAGFPPPAATAVVVAVQNQQPDTPDRNAPGDRTRQGTMTDEQPVGTAGEAPGMPGGAAILGWVILAVILIGGGLWYTTRRMNRSRTTDGGLPR